MNWLCINVIQVARLFIRISILFKASQVEQMQLVILNTKTKMMVNLTEIQSKILKDLNSLSSPIYFQGFLDKNQ